MTVFPITKRQDQIILMLADGMTETEIAIELGISVNTVKWHKTRIRFSLSARTSAHIVAKAYHLGILIPRIN